MHPERYENRVIAKPPCATRLANDGALDHSFDEALGPIRQCHSGRAPKRPASPALGHIRQLREHKSQVRSIVTMLPRPSCRQDPRHPVERIDAQP